MRLRQDASAIAADRQAMHHACVRAEDNGAARPQVPDLDRACMAAGRDLAAVRAEGGALDEIGVAVEGRHLTAGRDLPELEAPVLAGRGEGTAVRAEGQVEDEALVGEERESLHARVGLPQLD